MNELVIVKPTKDDFSSTCTVFELSIRDAFERDGLGHLKEDIKKEIEEKKNLLTYSLVNPDSDVHFFAAKLGGNVIGTISFGPCGDDIKIVTNNELADVGELGSLYVLPQFQRSGIGSALITAMINHLNKQGIEQFCLDSGYKQAQQIWLKKFGTPYAIAQDYWGEGYDHMVWLCSVRDFQTAGKLGS